MNTACNLQDSRADNLFCLERWQKLNSLVCPDYKLAYNFGVIGHVLLMNTMRIIVFTQKYQ
jgi:hypothetical protein